MFGLSQSAVALVLYAGGSFVISGHLSVGQLASFLLYVVFVAASLGMLTSVYGDFMKAVGASARVFELLERCAASYLVTAFSTVLNSCCCREPKINYKGGSRPEAAFGAIELHDVRFSYPSRSDQPVLRGLSLGVKPGQVRLVMPQSRLSPGHCGSDTHGALRRLSPWSGRVAAASRRCLTSSNGFICRSPARSRSTAWIW